MKQEKLPWLANNPFYTKRFAYYVGRRCRSATVRDVARELRLDWKTVKSLEMEYMREQLRRAGTPGPRVIGIDELSIGRGHNYRIVVSDLVRGRPIWFGGTDRSEKSMDLFFQWLGPRKCKGIRLAVMDMWKPFRNSTLKAGNAPQAGILYDKFHILKHLNEALDKVRKSEYARLSGKDRRFIKGQKYTLLSRRANLSQEGRQSLKALFKANRRLNKAYLLKEMFSQLWDYKRKVWARRFFERWKSALRWQRLKPSSALDALPATNPSRTGKSSPRRWPRRGRGGQHTRGNPTCLFPAYGGDGSGRNLSVTGDCDDVNVKENEGISDATQVVCSSEFVASRRGQSAPVGRGGGGIRTHGRLAPTTVFKTVLIGHSWHPPSS